METENPKLTRSETLPGCALSLALGEQANQHNAPIIIVTTDPFTAQRLTNEINFFKSAVLPLLSFPDWETLPYDSFSPHQEIISERLRTLTLLPTLNRGLLITTINTLMQRLMPRHFLDAHAFHLSIGDSIDLDKLKLRFVNAGYQNVAQVLAPGEFAVRGSLFDIYPMGSSLPYRIDLFDKDIESIRTFDPETQRTLEKINKIDLLPAREFPLTQESIALFRLNWREEFSGNPTECPIYETISQGGNAAGIEYYLPLFFQETATLFDYLPLNSLIIRIDNIATAGETFWQEIKTRYEQLRHDRTKPILAPEKIYINTTETITAMKRFSQKTMQLSAWQAPDLLIEHKSPDPLEKLHVFLHASHNQRILFCAESAGRREALLTLLHKNNITPAQILDWQNFVAGKQQLAITTAPLEQGAYLDEHNILILPEALLFGQQVLQQRRRKSKTTDVDSVVRNLAELTIGSPVVHVDHGIGRYLGLQTLTIGEQQGEFLTLEYADNAKLYVPVALLHLINRYSGIDPEHAPLHRLGSDQWEKAKRKAAEKIRDVAAELLALHAQREIRSGIAYPIPEDSYTIFANAFPFEETPDQQQAIEDVISDMRAKRGMDRLICGDVGFGKTEVAMRAAFIAVQSGHQVAVLVPTTLLAQQHYQNFSDRFADWPVKIDMLSRFKNKQEQLATLQQIHAGNVDIIIGTHKLLQPDIIFKNLGLVIIDEEHRFGVQQKERLKKLRAEVDILTLTATPIPRTLNMAMSGMRDLSIIGTPPAKRLSIKTFVHQYNTSLIREALLREIMRGGQVFYLHNDVATITRKAEVLHELVPEARLAVAHGQMRERELEQIMREFYHQHFNVLICTTIIETGIDIPSANTIIIDRADKFGLAQLHQLRGRVGRSHHQAYAYLLTPPKQALTADAQKRLDAIATLEDLGVGFVLATHDLEIRGAGEILGEGQSGNMQEIGYSLYMELLERAVNSLKKGEVFDINKSTGNHTEVDLQIPALIPEDYVPDVHSRLILYKRMASAKTIADLDELQVELIDRFGLLPEPTKNLFVLTEIKLDAAKMGIKKITGNTKNTRIEFIDKPNIEPMKIIQLIQKESHMYQLDGADRLKLIKEQPTPKEKINNLKIFLDKLL
jgi:transcription-repair coupling factor (superfamily II helicase)